MKKVLVTSARTAASVLFWIAVWFLVSMRVNNEFLFPAPPEVVKSLGRLIAQNDFWIITSSSLLRVVCGIAIGIVIGTVLAVLCALSGIINTLVSPMLSVVKATPVASFIILALVWMKRDILPVFITVLIVMPVVWSNIYSGIRSADKNLLEVTRVYGFSRSKKITRFYIPTVAPYFAAACRSSLGMAWKAGIAAEVLSVPSKAIGTELYNSKTYLETPDLFAWTLVVIILSVVIEKAVEFIMNKTISGKKHGRRAVNEI